jgi:hypothetical protein
VPLTHPTDGLKRAAARNLGRMSEMMGCGLSRWEVLKIILLALAVSVALTAAGALIAIGIAHL